MKEIWKLIELLNEYEKTLEQNLQIEWTEVWIKSTPEIVISKKFWFIKRLVENDKIDFEWMSWHWKIISYLTDEKDYKWNDIKEWVVLMLLSISSSPIEDLISYLK